jgi:hypothetical protein
LPAWVRSQEPQVIIFELSLSCHPQPICSPFWRIFFGELLCPHPTVSSAPTHPKPRKSKSRLLHPPFLHPPSFLPSLLPSIHPPTHWVEEVTFPLGQGHFLLLPSLPSPLSFYFLWCECVCVYMCIYTCVHMGTCMRMPHTPVEAREQSQKSSTFCPSPPPLCRIAGPCTILVFNVGSVDWLSGPHACKYFTNTTTPQPPGPLFFNTFFFHVLISAFCLSQGFRDPWPCRNPLVYFCSPSHCISYLPPHTMPSDILDSPRRDWSRVLLLCPHVCPSLNPSASPNLPLASLSTSPLTLPISTASRAAWPVLPSSPLLDLLIWHLAYLSLTADEFSISVSLPPVLSPSVLVVWWNI